jgi:hypothetical protein
LQTTNTGNNSNISSGQTIGQLFAKKIPLRFDTGNRRQITSFLENKQHFVKLLLILIIIEGLLCIPFLITPRTIEPKTWLFGLSRLKIAVLACYLLAMAAFIWITYKAFKFPYAFEKQLNNFEHFILTRENRLLILLSTIIFFCGTFIFFLVALLTPLAIRWWLDMPVIKAIFRNGLGLWIWLILILLSFSIMVSIRLRDQVFRHGFINWHIILRTLFRVIFFPISIFEIAILFFQLDYFQFIPFWYWQWDLRKSYNDWFFPILLVVIVLILFFVMKNNKPAWVNLIVLIALGYGLQFGFGYIEEKGFETAKETFLFQGRTIYLKTAATEPGILKTMIDYPSIDNGNIVLMTKPPGTMVLSELFEQLLYILHPLQDSEARYLQMVNGMAYIFPLMAMLVVPLLYIFSREYLDEKDSLLACALYVVTPTVILRVFDYDQSLYPVLFMIGLLFAQQISKRNSVKWAFITGFWWYLAIYVTFALLPMLPLILLMIGFEYLQEWRRKNHLLNQVKKGIGVISGVFAGFLCFRYMFGYDIFATYRIAFETHRLEKLYNPATIHIGDLLLLNNLEFMMWIGFGMVVLWIWQVFNQMKFIDFKLSPYNGLMISFVITYLALNLFGQTRSEVARLWIFIVPVICTLSAPGIRALFNSRSIGAMIVSSFQLITTFGFFKYMNMD